MQLAGAATEDITEDITLGLAVGSWVGGNVPGGAYDVRVPLLLILIGKRSAYHAGLAEVGGEKFFRKFKHNDLPIDCGLCSKLAVILELWFVCVLAVSVPTDSEKADVCEERL
ncbi:hypothetical protein R1sor_013567 [Riccia sorocarpa]|uniref:Uncharacterized protein n=1 Tax=Riccia sorocarpa TaxID=122646 RepID=A0ABD3H6Y2_9MARC